MAKPSRTVSLRLCPITTEKSGSCFVKHGKAKLCHSREWIHPHGMDHLKGVLSGQGKGHSAFVPDSMIDPTAAIAVPFATWRREGALQGVGQGLSIGVVQPHEEVQIGKWIPVVMPQSKLQIMPVFGVVNREVHFDRVRRKPSLRVQFNRVKGHRALAASHGHDDSHQKQRQPPRLARHHPAFGPPPLLGLRRLFLRLPELADGP